MSIHFGDSTQIDSASGLGAKLGQVKHGFCDVFSSSNSSYVDTGLSVTITPASSSFFWIFVLKDDLLFVNPYPSTTPFLTETKG